MKYLVCFIAMLFCCSNIYSQQSSLNLYSNWSYFAGQSISHINNNGSEFGYNGLSFSYRRVNENLIFHEFELKSGLRFKNENQIDNNKIYNHIRYEVGKQSKQKLFNKFDLQYGLAFKLFHFYKRVDPQAQTLFPSDEHKIGLSAAIITNLSYDINDRFSLQLKASLINLTFAGGVSKTYRPDISDDLRTNGNIDIDYFGEQTLRLGIGYKLGKKNKS